jgi:hypothetical protein
MSPQPNVNREPLANALAGPCDPGNPCAGRQGAGRRAGRRRGNGRAVGRRCDHVGLRRSRGAVLAVRNRTHTRRCRGPVGRGAWRVDGLNLQAAAQGPGRGRGAGWPMDRIHSPAEQGRSESRSWPAWRSNPRGMAPVTPRVEVPGGSMNRTNLRPARGRSGSRRPGGRWVLGSGCGERPQPLSDPRPGQAQARQQGQHLRMQGGWLGRKPNAAVASSGSRCGRRSGW